MVDAARIELELGEPRKDRWLFLAREGGRIVAELEATPHGDAVLIHHRVQEWGPAMCRVLRHQFRVIRAFLRAEGYHLVMTCSDTHDAKMQKYWRLMGFNVFYEVNSPRGPVPCAVMEV